MIMRIRVVQFEAHTLSGWTIWGKSTINRNNFPHLRLGSARAALLRPAFTRSAGSGRAQSNLRTTMQSLPRVPTRREGRISHDHARRPRQIPPLLEGCRTRRGTGGSAYPQPLGHPRKLCRQRLWVTPSPAGPDGDPWFGFTGRAGSGRIIPSDRKQDIQAGRRASRPPERHDL